MSASTKLSNSVKALCFLAQSAPDPRNSSEISNHTGVNASKVRKLLSDLAKKNIIRTIQGASGGFTLAKKPSQIHLQEIYCALEDRKAFYLDVLENSELILPGLVNSFFLDLFSEIQVEIEEKMREITLEQIIGVIEKKKVPERGAFLNNRKLKSIKRTEKMD